MITALALTVAACFPSVLHVRPAPPRPWLHAEASWYYDAGPTASGWHARYGVANLALPFGTRVRFAYGGRQVVATVDDRGPAAWTGRTWDLGQSTAGALGFTGVHLIAYQVLR